MVEDVVLMVVPIFIMGYSLVGDGSTYTKFGADCASAVF